MLNRERVHASPAQASAEPIELLDSERPSRYARPRLRLSAFVIEDGRRGRLVRRRRRRLTIRGQFAAYLSSTSEYDTHLLDRLEEPKLRSMPMKRCLDIVGALLLILVFAPITAVVALIVKLSSPGPVLFRQPRLGEQGELFTCLKFRTMVADAEGMLDRHPELRERFESEFKIKDDPRVTPIGKILRKTSLDELPQLINVLKGDMSLVGPRPIVPPEIEKYGRYGDKFLAVRPGLTGVWQVCGRSDTTYDERITMDMFYIDCHSVIMDLQLLASTVLSVLRCRGAY